MIYNVFKIKGITGLKSAIFLALALAIFVLSPSFSESLAADKTPDPGKINLSLPTIELWGELLLDRTRTREPAITFEVLKTMLEKGFPESIIERIIQLDKLTGNQAAIPIDPEAVWKLKKAGIKEDTIVMLLDAEITKAGGSVPHAGKKKMGIKIVTKADGKKTKVYFIGDPNKDRQAEEDKRQEREYRKALELLKHIQLVIEKKESN